MLLGLSALLGGLVAAPVFAGDVQEVLNKRCVVCHGCYDAPCQLKLSSPEGWTRGASKQKVYESSRLEDAPMTRLGIDAQTEAGWRTRGFFSVSGSNVHKSALVQLLEAGRQNTFALGEALPRDLNLALNRKLSCPAPGEVADYLSEQPHGGMPFGMAPLPEEEYQRLLEWARKGAAAPGSPSGSSQGAQSQLLAIETYFNRPDLRAQLIARYIYEHLFLAHLHLEGDTSGRFYRLIRSRTAPGKPAAEVATRRPFDDPGHRFFYRLVPITDTILHKEHIVYRIGPKRLDRFRSLFDHTDWSITELPAYSRNAGGNPLSTFSAIPARSRYQFLLDNALFFVRSFIRGPVCYGQVAVNVIEDRFWVSFLDPDADLAITDPQYLENAIPMLELPVATAGSKLTDRLRNYLRLGPVKYETYRQARYRENTSKTPSPKYDSIWDGDGHNKDARLTVFRNFSSASVVRGFVGDVPETSWVIDFPLFERIYYNLVAGFDVFGNVEHQLTTRLYMDSLRREGERAFLRFLPQSVRQPLHDSWYQGTLVNLVDRWTEAPLDLVSKTGIPFSSKDPKAEFLLTLLEQPPRLWPQQDVINRCATRPCSQTMPVSEQLRHLTGSPAPFAKFMPDISILIVEKGVRAKPDIFTLVHDMAHKNVAFIFNEDLRREPEKDRMTVVPGQFGSYPNFIFHTDQDSLPEFVSTIRSIRTQSDFLNVVSRFGLRRTDTRFWETFDQVQRALNDQDPVEAGLLDLNRYDDPKPSDPIDTLFDFRFFRIE